MFFRSLVGRPRGRPRIRWRNYVKDLTGVVASWNSTGGIADICKRLGYLKIPTRVAAPAFPKGQAGKEKYTELI